MNLGLVVVYCSLIILASLAGGLIPIALKLTHLRMQLATSFVAGFILGVAVLHLLPHALMVISPGMAVWWILIGLLLMFFLERFFCFHHHDAPDAAEAAAPPAEHEHAPGEAHEHDHGHDDEHAPKHTHDHDHAHSHEHALSWTGVLVGLTVHSVIAGIALGASMQAESVGPAAFGLAGLAVFLIIFLHKPFDALTVSALLGRSGYSMPMRHLVNALFALAVPLGVGLFLLGLAGVDVEHNHYVGAAVAFSCGVFLCVSLSDLLPELQFHHHDRGKLSLALLLGIGLAMAVAMAEAHAHGHGPGGGHGHDDHGAHAEQMDGVHAPAMVDDDGHAHGEGAGDHDHDHDHDH